MYQLFYLYVVYGWAVFVSLTNLVLMRRPKGSAPCCFEVMVPARDEEANLARLIPLLVGGGCRVTVFDDASKDATAEVARGAGAEVIVGGSDLPAGWTGKAWGCSRLTLEAREDWVVFLDADTIPSPGFVPALSAFLGDLDPATGVVSGFLRMIPGRGPEPAYMNWVSWILLSTNPFGLVARAGFGHNFFLNGQFSAWRRETLVEIKPFDQVRGEILEDVKIGRLLARIGVKTEIVDMSRLLSVAMYKDLGSAIQGMSKNSADIAPGWFGCVLFAAILCLFGFGWVLAGSLWWHFLIALLASSLPIVFISRTPLWAVPFLPLSLLAGAITVVRSRSLKSLGRITWKGRSY
jgi:glycosyltransferase involved in cell wall biosynthesis